MIKHYPLISTKTIPETVILANGEFPTHSLPLALLKQAKYVVCCDGAANEYIKRGFIPNAIIGDGDSLSSENKDRFADILHFNNDQETNDQTKAVNYCIEQGRKDIIIVGATGKREDHTLGNISLLIDYMDEVRVQMVTNYGIFNAVCGNATFECIPEEQISIINFTATRMEGEGVAYPLRGFTNWWQGTLNEAKQENITIWANGKYLLFRNII
ncbi:thiamine diphosphokinase [Bacteroides sp. 224]|uniref:thiamine diphosphokinase n=1 Tax=Bacteroides sp. 224 TaxID=2302936 RepID=UPI0013D31BD0|nr:thiamine diphosphokinase [Bacteroides sp. 224]NDV64080.1 thiamine diphosphokinase [Bacteroides sp. 224]